MKAPCLYHHRVREGFFKLDQIPSELVANVFKYVPTLDIGRMMVVCRGFNDILSTNPSLWRIIDLDKVTPNKNAFKIIKIFAARSRNTLVSITTPESMTSPDMEELALLLEESKATLRRIGMRFWPHDEAEEDINFFKLFPVIERLNLTTIDLPEREHIPGVLTMLAWINVGASNQWDDELLGKMSNITTLYLEEEDDFYYQGGFLYQILEVCSPSLVNLSLMCASQEFTPLDFDLPNLSNLTLGIYGNYENLFTRPLPKLEHIEGDPKIIGRFDFKKLSSFVFLIGSSDYGEEDDRYDGIEEVIRLVKDSSSTLRSIKLLIHHVGWFRIDPFLRTLKVDYILPVCPLLSDLFISKEQQFNFTLLAEVMVSRNFAAKGWKFEGEDGNGGEEEEGGGGEAPERRYSNLVLHLDNSHIKEFKLAEEEVLSRIPRWMSRQAGRTTIKEWDGK